MIRLTWPDGSFVWINSAAVLTVEVYVDPVVGKCTRVRLLEDVAFVFVGDHAQDIACRIHEDLLITAALKRP